MNVTLAALGKALADGQSVRAEVRLERFDGVYRWFDARTVPLRDEGGRIVKWFGSGSDILEERELREALRKERDRLAKVAAAVPGAINSFRVTRDGAMSFSFSSPATKEVFGITPEALADDAGPYLRRVHPEDEARSREAVQQSARAMSQFHSVYRFAHPTKGERWVDTCSLPVAESDGTITWHGYSRDVTEERQAEEQLLAANQALRESEEQFRTLIAEASDPIMAPRRSGAARGSGFRPCTELSNSTRDGSRCRASHSKARASAFFFPTPPFPALMCP